MSETVPAYPDELPDGSIRRRSLAKALDEAGMTLDEQATVSESASEEDYDENVRPSITSKLPKASGLRQRVQPRVNGEVVEKQEKEKAAAAPPPLQHIERRDSGVHVHPLSLPTFTNFLTRSQQRAAKVPTSPFEATSHITPFETQHLRDFIFKKQFSKFDRWNSESVNSPFWGFFTLFWMGVAFLVAKIVVYNWKTWGSVLGGNEMGKLMFGREVLVLLASDGVMCAATGVSWVIQRLVQRNVICWERSGWIVQNIWQTVFIAAVIAWTLVREWPFPHTIFLVLHGLVMLMKQHAYAFYNGHLSAVYNYRRFLQARLKDLEAVHPNAEVPADNEPGVGQVSTDHLDVKPSAESRRASLSAQHDIANPNGTDIERISKAVREKRPLNDAQVALFARMIRWEIDALGDELKGTAQEISKAYPANLGFWEFYGYIPLPTLVYEIEYPRTEGIDWWYVAEKAVAMVGVMFVMVQVSQYAIYPVVMKTVAMKQQNLPLTTRFSSFPSLLLDLIFPFMMEYLLVWYLIWETILNLLAELTRFADRSFYDAWWNSVSWDQFARDWNRPVHIFLLRHVYHSSISTFQLGKRKATLITFLLSAVVHELVMWCLFRKLRGYLLVLQMFQLPLVSLSRTKWLRGRKTLGNMIFWLGIFTGPSLLCSLYLIL